MQTNHLFTVLFTAGLLCTPATHAAPVKKVPATQQAFPAAHEAQYQQFKQQLQGLTKKNSFDLSKALFTILKATNDEFSIEQWMQRAADEGEPAAMLFMAQKHLIMLPKEKYRAPEVRTAVTKIKKASDAKYVPAMVEYSRCLKEGIGAFKNEAAAEKLLIQACSGGSFEARFAWLLQTERMNTYEDMQRPEIQAEIKRGNHYVLQHMSILAKENKAILQLLNQAALKGNGRAYYELSELIKEVNIAESYRLLQSAVRFRNPDALYRMAMYMIAPPPSLEINVGPVRNPQAGVIMLKMASILGQIDSRAELSRIYYEGKHGQSKDYTKAYRHATIGAMLSGAPALLAAQGQMLLNGIGTQQDLETGIKLIKTASRQYTHAKSLLGYAYFKGLGVTKNISTATMHFEDAVAHKDPVALIYLALMFDAENQASKSQYYLDHAESKLPGKAKIIFKNLKATPGGWQVPPFPL
ncbi:MAG: sel1 repeat family protein [Akkermansia sp.]|nr:sel1 repeat family protein [Akkermansia sp.]